MARQGTSAKRNIFLYAVAVALLAGLIFAVSVTRKPVRILPPESDEIIAKRQAPENAYFTLVEASKLIPKCPKPALVPDERNPKVKFPYKAESGSLGRLVGVDRPDADPELAAYLDACAPAVAKLREAFAKPYYLVQTTWSDFATLETNTPKLRGERSVLTGIAPVLAGCAVRSARAGGDGAEAFQYLQDLFRLQNMVSGDGAGWYNLVPQGLWYILEVARASSDAVCRSALDEMAALHRELKPPLANLEYGWRVVDNVAKVNAESSATAQTVVMNLIESFQLGRARRAIVANQDLLRHLVTLSYPEFMSWANEARSQDEAAYACAFYNMFRGLAPPVRILVSNRAYADTVYSGTELLIALELFRRERGEYPAALDALAPQYFGAVPSDPYTGAPLIYRRVDKDYVLYSLGDDQKDGGGTEQRGDYVIHKPPEPI